MPLTCTSTSVKYLQECSKWFQLLDKNDNWIHNACQDQRSSVYERWWIRPRFSWLPLKCNFDMKEGISPPWPTAATNNDLAFFLAWFHHLPRTYKEIRRVRAAIVGYTAIVVSLSRIRCNETRREMSCLHPSPVVTRPTTVSSVSHILGAHHYSSSSIP